MSEPRAPDAATAAATADHRNTDGTFRNPWPDSGTHGLSDVLRWMRERRRTGRAPTPPRNSFPTSAPELVQPRAARDDARATWVGHSTVLLQVGGLNVLTDPMWSERASPVQWVGPRRVMAPALSLESLPPLDVVLLSHSHYDHLDKGTVKRLASRHPDAQWVAPLGLGRYLRRFGVRKVSELDWWQRVSHRGATVTATPARHFSARRPGDRNRTLWCGYAVEIQGRRMYFAGDTAYHPAFREISARCGPFDFVMMPIGAYDPRWFMRVVHVDPAEAVQACADLRSAHPGHDMPLMLGIHWGTFRLTDEPMDEPPRRTTELWNERGFGADRLWIARFGETRAW
jgi:N-acyl-phosphatidylethanolamine-hydrolysing phospholipase D